MPSRKSTVTTTTSPRVTIRLGGVSAPKEAAFMAVAALVGALLGNLAGMRFHRKIDEASFDPRADAARVR